ncbi:hypothetical protein HAZT_HAZT009883 [Hyalella azteca]|nr:hypothetical protein HAZT_HAZT009883 [Hyalella azteca]
MSQNPEYPHILQQGNLTTQWNKSYKEISIICSADSGMKLAGSSLPSPNSRDDCIPNKNDAGTNPLGLPTPDKLKHVHDVLVSSLKKFFAQTPNYTIFDKDVIFENRFRGTVTKGLFLYVTQMYILNTIGHMKHAYVHMDIIKTTIHPEDGTVKVRWRIKGIKSRQAFIGFWKARKWSISDVKQDDMFNWYDGFSTFHVNSEGLIYRHVADNMMPDEEKLSSRPGTIAKLAVAIGLWPRPVAGHSSVIQEMPSLF